jgi:tetratricopeptide (TPR) repeat protein
MRSLVVLALAASCYARRQARVAETYEPRSFPREPDERATKRTLLVRVWADQDYQKATLGWQVRTYEQIERTNEVLRATLGIALDLVEVKTWDRTSRLGAMSPALVDLEAIDPGKDVDLVVGLMTPLTIATSSFHELGMARLLGRHIVLRGMDDEQELRSFREAFHLMDAEDVADLYTKRLRHKEESVLIHELGHVLGAIHTKDATEVMHPDYSYEIGYLSPASIELMQLGLDRHARDVAPEMIAALDRFDVVFVDQARAMMRAFLEKPAARATDADVLEERPKEGERRTPLDDARSLAGEGKVEAAWALLEPMRGDDRAAPTVCAVASRLGAKTASIAEGACARAVELDPADPVPALYLAAARLDRGEDGSRGGDALASITEAERRLAASERGAGVEAWGYLAHLYSRAWALARAEDAAQRAPETEEGRSVLAWVAKTRKRLRLPRGAVEAAREPEYIGRRHALDDLLAKGRHDVAKSAARALAADFPGLSDEDVTLCIIGVDRRAFAEALPHCQRAADAREDDPEMLGYAGFAAFGARKAGAAIPYLERAVDLAPDNASLRSLLEAARRSAQRRRR